jgi:hypothetical protein
MFASSQISSGRVPCLTRVASPASSAPTPPQQGTSGLSQGSVPCSVPCPFSAEPTSDQTTITLWSELRFWWSWTLWKAYSEGYTTHMVTWSKSQWTKAVFHSKGSPIVRETSKQLLLCKCANTTKWTSPCASVLAFSQSFSKDFLLISPCHSILTHRKVRSLKWH